MDEDQQSVERFLERLADVWKTNEGNSVANCSSPTARWSTPSANGPMDAKMSPPCTRSSSRFCVRVKRLSRAWRF
jgi:hypothetical protein